MLVLHPTRGGGLFGLVWRIMILGKRRITKKLDYVNLIINYFNNRRGEGGGVSRGNIWVCISEEYN